MLQNQNTQELLSKKERIVCQKLVAMEIVLISQRAHALLLLDEGYTHADTAQKTGLSIGQVRYALRTFRSKGLELFPQDPPVENDANVPVQAEPVEEKGKGKSAKKATKKISLPIKKKKQKKKNKSKAKKAKKKGKKSKKEKEGKKGKKKIKKN